MHAHHTPGTLSVATACQRACHTTACRSQELASALDSAFAGISKQAGSLRQQAAEGKITAQQAAEALVAAFIDLLNLLRRLLAPSGNRRVLELLDRCQVQATAGARMVADAAAANADASAAAAAVQQFADLLLQLRTDLAAELALLSPSDVSISLFGAAAGNSGSSGSIGSSGSKVVPIGAAADAVGSFVAGLQQEAAAGLQQLQTSAGSVVQDGLANAGGAVQEVCVAAGSTGLLLACSQVPTPQPAHACLTNLHVLLCVGVHGAGAVPVCTVWSRHHRVRPRQGRQQQRG